MLRTMIAKLETAKYVNEAVLDVYSRLIETAQRVKAECTEEEYTQYNRAAGKVACRIVFDILEPLYELNPSLKPDGWDELSTGL
jgi:hypothetical protein